jgi:Xaa-Pro dipeptidase
MLTDSLSRRSILRISAALSSSSLLRGQPSSHLPPAIAALPSLKAQARPFTTAEFEHRVERARRLMAQNGMEAIVLGGGTSTQYFANIRIHGGERLWALVIPRRNDAFLVCPAFEEDRAHELLSASPFRKARVLTWQEDEDPSQLLVRGLKDRHVSTGKVGIDEMMPLFFVEALSRVGGSALQMVSATPVTAGCRMVKDDHEIECLKLAGKATLLVYEAVYKSLKPGMTQDDTLQFVNAGYERVGFPGEADVNVDQYTALPHGSETPQIIKEGSIIMLDDGCRVEGYWSDVTRTFVLGEATPKMTQVFDIVQRAQQAALKAAKPNVQCGAVDEAARKVIADAGYGPGYKYFTHRVGHGLGMDMHEWNYLVPNNMHGWVTRPVLGAGMVFSNEPGIYIKGEFGIRLEDDMHITVPNGSPRDGLDGVRSSAPSVRQSLLQMRSSFLLTGLICRRC